MDKIEYYEDILPEGAVPECGFRILSYILADGSIGFRISQSGDVPVTGLVGLLEMAKHDICMNAITMSKQRRANEE